jgi:hypothetical protein
LCVAVLFVVDYTGVVCGVKFFRIQCTALISLHGQTCRVDCETLGPHKVDYSLCCLLHTSIRLSTLGPHAVVLCSCVYPFRS